MSEGEVTFPGAEIELHAFQVTPEGGNGALPAVIVIHEADGLTDTIRNIARRFGERGYLAFAVDLFRGRSRAACMVKILYSVLAGSLDSFGVRDIKAAITHLAAQPNVDAGRIGTIGFCLGGGFSVALACSEPRVRAVAPFYGANPRPLDVSRACPVVGSYPERDFTKGAGHRLQVALSAAGIPNDIKIYPGARHSFMNDRSRAFDPVASEDALARVFAFFAEHLAPLPASLSAAPRHVAPSD